MKTIIEIARMKELHDNKEVHPSTVTNWTNSGLPFHLVKNSKMIDVEEFKVWWKENNMTANGRGRPKTQTESCIVCGKSPTIAKSLCSKCYARERRAKNEN